MTPTFDYEQVRLLMISQIQQLPGFTHARHLFGGVKLQGAVIGDRTFDILAGTSRPAGSARSGAEQVTCTFRTRLRHRASPLQGAEVTTRAGTDRRLVENVLRQRGRAIPTAIRVDWAGSTEPTEVVKGFLDTDILMDLTWWSIVTAPVETAAAGTVL